jgi:hypothetical protein
MALVSGESRELEERTHSEGRTYVDGVNPETPEDGPCVVG